MTEALIETIGRFGAARVLVIGDVMLDRYIVGGVSRISPEAPVPVVRVERENEMPGGAGNTARNVASLGAACTLISVVGEDAEGEALLRHLAEAGIRAKLIRDSARCTTVKTRIVAHNQQIVRADKEITTEIGSDTERAARDAVRDAVPEADVIVVSDYGKGLLTPALLADIYRAARDAGVPTITDPTGRDLARYRGTTYLKPNRNEVLLATGLRCDDDQEATAAGLAVIGATGAKAILISRSEQGISVVRAEGPAAHLRAEAREVFDVSGAGDTVVATAAVALAAGADIVAAAEIANIAAGVVVGKSGTAVVGRDELLRALRRAAGSGAFEKIVDLETAARRVADWKARGLSVGLTNGCFDLLHPGHVGLLAAARAACDRLVVALNDDGSVRRLKGPGRPINEQGARAEVLASLQPVDLVTLFAADTPIEVIEALRPALLVKGGDYRPEQVVGRELVESYGGRVLIAPYIGGHSTTSTIGRINTSKRPA